MSAVFFKDQNDFRQWLEKNHEKETELLVGFYKIGSGKPSMTWSESVDQALCYGWIDGVRRSINEESYSIRFTPRKPTSIWSNVNINKVKVLTEKGLMQPKGIAAYDLRKPEKSGIYSFENETIQLSPEYEKIFRKHKDAWNFFENLAPGYKKITLHRIMSPKQEQTRLSRLEKIIEQFKNGIKPNNF